MSAEGAQREIVSGLRAGSRDAWNALCQQYSSRVWGYVARLIGSDREAVADVYQETMLAVARSGRSIQADTRLWAWLAKIAHNQAALYWRKQYRTRGEAAELDQLVSGSAADPSALLAQAESVEAIRRLLAEMDADHVALLTAKYLDELPIAEMADRLGGSSEAIRSRLARARREFRRRYDRLSGQTARSAAVRSTSPRKGD